MFLQLKNLQWLLFCLSLLIFALGISWQINRSVNFTYPIWYQALDISAHIKTYAPQNKYNKQDFVFTSEQQHLELFAEVVDEIHNQGVGLENISYKTPAGKVKTLFTQAEVIHLQDVANLIDSLTIVWLLNLLPLSFLSYSYKVKNTQAPNNKTKVAVLITAILSVVIAFAIFGFKSIFYWFHTVIFPDNHQWFFYYQESLMSTFMKAPDLFGAIAGVIFLVMLPIYYFSYIVVVKNRK
ncbi:DUF1461 domain-containing protein [Colwelliaceae bacterium BS250]